MESPSTGSRQSPRAPARRRRFLALLAGSVLVSWVAMAAVVSMHPPSGGGELRIPVMLYGDQDEHVSGLQFDLAYDPTQYELVGISAGDAATGAGKEVILSASVPGQGRVLITGFNNNGMSDGQVATLTLRPLNGSAPQHGISLGQVLASDPDGNSVPIDYADLYQYPPPAPLDEELVPTPEDVASEPLYDTTEESPDVESTDESGEPEGGETAPESGGGSTPTNSGVIGNGFAGSSDGRLDSPENGQNGKSNSSATRPGRNAFASGSTGWTSGRNSQPGSSDDGAFSNGRAERSVSRPTDSVSTSPGRDGVRPQQPATPKSGGSTTTGQSNSTAPTEMALLRPASGLVDPPDSGLAAYTLALYPAEVKAPERSTRAIIAVLTVSLTVALLALIHLLFGRASRPSWRKTR